MIAKFRVRVLSLLALAVLAGGCGEISLPGERRISAAPRPEPPAARPATPSRSAPEVELEQAILRRINQQRRRQGLATLEADPGLTSVARTYSRRMAAAGFFEHTAPEGDTLVDRLRGAGIRYRMAGENLYKGYNVPDPADDAVKTWMNSAGHRKNILRPEFRQTGIGAWRNGRNVYITQVFLRR